MNVQILRTISLLTMLWASLASGPTYEYEGCVEVKGWHKIINGVAHKILRC